MDLEQMRNEERGKLTMFQRTDQSDGREKSKGRVKTSGRQSRKFWWVDPR